MVLALLWFAVGIYGALSNIERVPRVFPDAKDKTNDIGQHFCTVMLGPIGLALVLLHGGKIKFW